MKVLAEIKTIDGMGEATLFPLKLVFSFDVKAIEKAKNQLTEKQENLEEGIGAQILKFIFQKLEQLLDKTITYNLEDVRDIYIGPDNHLVIDTDQDMLLNIDNLKINDIPLSEAFDFEDLKEFVIQVDATRIHLQHFIDLE